MTKELNAMQCDIAIAIAALCIAFWCVANVLAAVSGTDWCKRGSLTRSDCCYRAEWSNPLLAERLARVSRQWLVSRAD